MFSLSQFLFSIFAFGTKKQKILNYRNKYYATIISFFTSSTPINNYKICENCYEKSVKFVLIMIPKQNPFNFERQYKRLKMVF